MPKPSTSLSSSGNLTEATHAGTVSFATTLQDDTTVTMEIGPAIYQPSSPCNLLSSLKLMKDRVFWNQFDHTLYRHDDNQVLAEMRTDWGVPTIDAQPSSNFTSEPALVSVPYRKMHRRLMHASKVVVEAACKRAGIVLTHKEDSLCEGCLMGKASDELGKQAPVQCVAPFDFVRVDMVKHRNPGHLGYQYSVHIIDVWSNYHWVKFARTKDACFNALKDFAEMIETQTGRKIKIIGIDGGSEFKQATHPFFDSVFKAWVRSKGMVSFVTPPHTPWMNGKIERAAKEVLEKSRAAMIAYRIPERLFPFVMETVVQIMNLLPTKGNMEEQCPQQMFATALNMPEEAHQPHIGHLRAYFCEAYYYVKPAYRANSDKFTPRAKKARLIGYADLHGKIYWLWNPVTDEVVRASAVKFNEGPDLQPDDDVGAEYEVVFEDSTPQEEEDGYCDAITIVHPSGKEHRLGERSTPNSPAPQELVSSPGQEEDEEGSFGWYDADEEVPEGTQLLTPEATPNPRASAFPSPSPTPTSLLPDRPTNLLDGCDRQEIQQEAPIPPDHPLAPYTGHANLQSPPQPVGGSAGELSQPAGGSTAQSSSSRPRRNKAKHGTGEEEGYYAKLAEGKLPGQNYFSGHLVEPLSPNNPVMFAMSHLKAEHEIETSCRSNIPQNYRQAQRHADFRTRWLPAMQKQLKALQQKKVFKLVRKRPGMTTLPSKWVFDEKMDLETREALARARIVVCGNFEQGSWNAQDVYAAVVNSVTVKVFLALVATLDLECYQFDFVAAFLNSLIPEGAVYYVQPPPGLDTPEGFVWLLCKALYGLRESPLYWFLTIRPVMEKLGFEVLFSDLCLFRHKDTGALVIIYVDDLLVAAKTVEIIDNIRDQLMAIYELKELGEVRRFLGYDVVRDRSERKVYVSQASYIKTMLLKLGMWDCNPVSSPWPTNKKFDLPMTWEPLVAEQKAYIKKTGSINWVSTGTRPDIAYTASRLCEANAGPSEDHLDLMHHLFRYLKGTWDFALCFGGKELTADDLRLMAFGDASHADHQPSRHSTGGHVVFVAGGPVLWKTKRQTFVALSSTEAEFANLTPTGQAVLWVADILKDCGYAQSTPQILYTDSLNAYLTVMNPLNVARTRCIDIRYKWAIEQVQQGRLKIQHIEGLKMPADGLTKPLGREKHSQFLDLLGILRKPIPWLDG